MVAITVTGLLVGALTGLTGRELGMFRVDAGATSLYPIGIDPIVVGGCHGAVAGGVVASGTLAISAVYKDFRRKLLAATERVGRCLNFLAVLGVCSILLTAYITQAEVDYDLNFRANITLLIIVEVALGVAAGIALGLIVGLLVVFFLVVVVLGQVSAGLICSARKRPESVPADLIDGAYDPWPIRTAAALMPPEAGRRWRDDFNEARYDYEDDQHAKLLRDFLLHAPAVVVWAWIAFLQRRLRGADSPQGRRW
ncbi:hypothetical protein ABZ439_08025 [Streptomyces sp. NPDC005840]|uniref:hypothetical protein n=1 Tax=Streptomyces sp. NPDC005840 TaxID=3157072 RepID=UPI0033F9988D